MKVSGDATLTAPPERVFAALQDPGVLARTIPGVERLDPLGPDRYRMTVTAGVASIKGVYSGEVALTDQVPPASFVLRASGAGAPGTVSADVRVSLADAGEGRTRLEYDADAVVGGMIGGVGQRVLVGVAKKTAGEFFRNVDDVLTGRAAAPAPPEQRAGEQVPAAAEARFVPAGGDFLRGAVVGAAIALAGVVVGAVLGRRR